MSYLQLSSCTHTYTRVYVPLADLTEIELVLLSNFYPM